MRRHVTRPEMKIECEIFYPVDLDRRLLKEAFICAVSLVRRFDIIMKSENNKYMYTSTMVIVQCTLNSIKTTYDVIRCCDLFAFPQILFVNTLNVV